MKPYVMFKAQTGEIVGTGFADPEQWETMCPEGMRAIGGDADLSAHYVDVTTDTVKAKRANPARPFLTAGKVGEVSGIKNVVEGSLVVVRNPGDVVVARLVPSEGEAYYVPQEPGRHRWEVSHPSTFPIKWPLDVLA